MNRCQRCGAFYEPNEVLSSIGEIQALCEACVMITVDEVFKGSAGRAAKAVGYEPQRHRD